MLLMQGPEKAPQQQVPLPHRKGTSTESTAGRQEKIPKSPRAACAKRKGQQQRGANSEENDQEEQEQQEEQTSRGRRGSRHRDAG